MRRGETPPPEGLTDHIASGFGESEFLRSTQKSEIHPTEEQQIRIRRRTALLLERRKAMSNLEHLKYDDWERLSVLKNGAKLRGISNEHEADVIESRLHENMPWMAEATEVFWLAMRRSVREGALGLKIPPILLIARQVLVRVIGPDNSVSCCRCQRLKSRQLVKMPVLALWVRSADGAELSPDA